MKYYKSRTGEEKIRAYNHLNGNDVYTGQVLDIPLMDEQGIIFILRSYIVAMKMDKV